MIKLSSLAPEVNIRFPEKRLPWQYLAMNRLLYIDSCVNVLNCSNEMADAKSTPSYSSDLHLLSIIMYANLVNFEVYLKVPVS